MIIINYPILNKKYRDSCRDKIYMQLKNNFNEYNGNNEISVINILLNENNYYIIYLI